MSNGELDRFFSVEDHSAVTGSEREFRHQLMTKLSRIEWRQDQMEKELKDVRSSSKRQDGELIEQRVDVARIDERVKHTSVTYSSVSALLVSVATAIVSFFVRSDP